MVNRKKKVTILSLEIVKEILNRIKGNVSCWRNSWINCSADRIDNWGGVEIIEESGVDKERKADLAVEKVEQLDIHKDGNAELL